MYIYTYKIHRHKHIGSESIFTSCKGRESSEREQGRSTIGVPLVKTWETVTSNPYEKRFKVYLLWYHYILSRKKT